MYPGKHNRLAVVAGLLSLLALTTPAPAGIPICDQLRKCAGELATTMSRGTGWRPETIAQYRRMSVAPLERAPNADSVCRGTLQVIGGNAAKYHEQGKLKRLPESCRTK